MQWLEEDSDHGYQMMTEIAEEVMVCDKTDEKSNDDKEEGRPICKIRLSELRLPHDDFINCINSSSNSEVQPYYSHYGAFRQIIIHKHQTSKMQLKLNSSQLANQNLCWLNLRPPQQMVSVCYQDWR